MDDDTTAVTSTRTLSQGHEILWYTIDRVLGQGGFGITYLAHDRNLDRSVAIKEYLPTIFAYRREDFSVKPINSDHRDNFVWGLNSFLKEAQTLARFSHPNIVRVNSVFEANNTAYMVMEYEHGQNLTDLYKNNDKRRDQSFIEQIFFPIFDGLKEIHKFDFIHRDIKPGNIYIRDDQTPVLIDFGSARQTSQQQISEMTSLVSKGYTPLEQYSISYGEQGPWTDIYALAATMHEGIVGSKPDESLSRSACLLRGNPDLVAHLSNRDYPGFSQQFLDSVHAGLRLEPEARPQSIEDWADMFNTTSADTLSSTKRSGITAFESDLTQLKTRLHSDEFDDDARGHIDKGSHHNEYEFRQPRGDSQYFDNIPANRNNRNAASNSVGGDAFNRRNLIDRQSDNQPFDELLDFDDDEPFGNKPNAMRPSSESSKRSRSSTSRSSTNRSLGPMVVAALVLALLSAGAGYMYYTSSATTVNMSLATINKMPRPPQSITTTLPKDNALEQLDYMTNMAPMLAQAYSINPNDPVLLDTIQQTEQSLLSLAKTWNASRYGDVVNQILAVSSAMPAAVHDQGRIQSILATSNQVLAYDQIMTYLKDKHYLRPSGSSVLDKISSVNFNEYQQLKSTSQWQQMMTALSQSAMEKLAKSEFDEVAKLTEAALSLDADHAGFNALKLFLAGS